MTDLHPRTIEQAIVDLQRALAEPKTFVVPTNELMLEIVVLLARLKHS